jgi:hypothetical protein
MTKVRQGSNRDKRKGANEEKEDYGSKMRKLLSEREETKHRVVKKKAKRKKK